MHFSHLIRTLIQGGRSSKNFFRYSILLSCALCATATDAWAQKAAESNNMELVGANDLQGRGAYQPVIEEQNGRWIAYVGHHGGTPSNPKPINPLNGQHEFNGTSIIDVTDPAKPKYLFHIPGEEGMGESGGGQMARVCSGKQLPKGDPSKFYLLRVFGNHAHEIWDVTDPAKPNRIAEITDVEGTHKNFWECDTGIAYLVSGAPGWRVKRMTQVYDLSDPAKPVFIRNFGLPGQQPGATGPVPEGIHGAISIGAVGNRVYFGYGTNQNGMLQIVDRNKLLTGPKEPTDANLAYPEVGRLVLSPKNGSHTTFPIIGVDVPEFAKDKDSKRNFVLMVPEALASDCTGPREMAWLADITVENKPQVVSNYTVPEASGNFCSRGGRFGTHASSESFSPIYYKRIVFLSHFNAGVRAVDIRNPYAPKEVGYYIPAVTNNTFLACPAGNKDGNKENCKAVIQTNNVEVDDRGYIYIVDRAGTGMHILQLTGDARKIANFPL